jgi:ParB family chromosome partitioning protein
LTEDNKNKIQSLEIPLDSLQLAEWDIRRTTETQEEFEPFKNPIQENGLNPLIVARMSKTGELIIVAGRKRLRAVKELGLKTVPVIVQFKDVTETELRRITLVQNLHRKDLQDKEKGFGIISVYEAAGYTGEQAIKGVKSIDNWFSQHTNHKVDWDAFIR